MTISGSTRLVGILGDPVAASLSPRMQNAAFAALALPYAYVPLHIPAARLEQAIRGLVALGFAGANVTIPHKLAVVALCDEVEDGVESVNTLVVRDGRLVGSSTDTEALVFLEHKVRTAAVVGAGGAAVAWIAALEARGAEVAVFSRRGEWPPVTDGADLVVHATPVKDALLFEPRGGQCVIDLAYNADGRPTALAGAAREAGCELVDGLEVLVRQGAASFTRWTGIEAPVEVMRAAVDWRR